MSALLISLLTLVLVLTSAFIVLLVLMQRTSQSGGMGAALGGGAAESAFGADTSNVLTKGTIYGVIAFFVVALVLYLIYQGQIEEHIEAKNVEELVGADEPEPVAETTIPVEGPVIDTTAEDLLGTVENAPESVTEQAEDAVQTDVEAAPAVEVPAAEPKETKPATN